MAENYDNPLGQKLPAEEKQLINELRTGAPGAFERLFHRYWRMIMRLCLARLEDTAEAEDVAIETFTAAAKGIRKFRGEARLSTWLYRICLNRIARQKRKEARNPEIIPVDNCPEDAATQEPDRTPDRLLILRQALADLPARDRTILILRYLENLRPAEIGAILGINPSAVSMRLRRAEARLRQAYERRQR
ncbi:MAG: sigma-70 family RNA polymerase sigma factor [candidate division WOR-3 bacterium]|nr:sigma-70 family RNA polymerase sigma factor [candidate division WOR-3 bacterium]